MTVNSGALAVQEVERGVQKYCIKYYDILFISGWNNGS